jgi:hypothetical protein
MNKSDKKKIQLAIYALLTIRNERYRTNALSKEIFDFQTRARKHYAEYNEAIEYLENMLKGDSCVNCNNFTNSNLKQTD